MCGNFFLNILLPSLECKNIRAIDYKFFWGNMRQTLRYMTEKGKKPYFSKMIREYSSVVHYLTCWKGLKKSQKNHFYRLNCVENAFNVFNRPENMISTYFITYGLNKFVQLARKSQNENDEFSRVKIWLLRVQIWKVRKLLFFEIQSHLQKIYEWY